jgi:hypothetical protein
VDDRDQYLALLAEEYRTLANSGNQADRHTYTALQWGTAVVGIVVSAAISQWGKHDRAVEMVFLCGIPAIVAGGMLYWIGELARMRRIYDFMCVIEVKAEAALKHSMPGATGTGWLESFASDWTANRRTLLAELELAVPVDIGSGPIEFERWLRRIRNSRASSNLTWVFLVRFVLFPATTAASWTIGVYYALFQSVAREISFGTIVVAVCGLILGVVTVWLAVELVTDLNESASQRASQLPAPGRFFRRIVAAPLHMTEWAEVDSTRGIDPKSQ